MNKTIRFFFVAVIVVLPFLRLLSYAADDPADKSPKLIASGPGFTIHQFEGFIKNKMVESVLSNLT